MENLQSGPSRVRLESNGYTQAKTYEKTEIGSSDKWDLVDHPSWLESKAHAYAAGVYRKTLASIQETLNEAFSRTPSGTVAILALGIELKQLKRELRVLTAVNGDRQWGDRREKIRLLKEYGMSEYIFDNNQDKRELLLHLIEIHIGRKERLMRDVASQFNVEIPLDAQFELFSRVN